MELGEWLDIILQYLKVLAWPLVVFTLAIVYRKPVITLLQRLKKYSGWGQTVELGDRARDLNLESVEVLSETLPPEPEPEPEPETEPGTGTGRADTPATRANVAGPPEAPSLSSYRIRTLPELDADERIIVHYLGSLDRQHFERAAQDMIENAWIGVERVARQIANEINLESWATKGLTMFSHGLATRNLISIQTANLAAGLDELHRNIQRASADELTPYVVSDFVSTSERLAQAMQQVLNSITLNRLLDEADASEIQDDPSPQTLH